MATKSGTSKRSTAGKNKSTPSRGLRRDAVTVADWESADAAKIKAAIVSAGLVGGAIRFGISRDGGAFGLGIYGDGDPYTAWVSCRDDIDEVLDEVRELYESIADDPQNVPF